MKPSRTDRPSAPRIRWLFDASLLPALVLAWAPSSVERILARNAAAGECPSDILLGPTGQKVTTHRAGSRGHDTVLRQGYRYACRQSRSSRWAFLNDETGAPIVRPTKARKQRLTIAGRRMSDKARLPPHRGYAIISASREETGDKVASSMPECPGTASHHPPCAFRHHNRRSAQIRFTGSRHMDDYFIRIRRAIRSTARRIRSNQAPQKHP